MMRQRQKQQPDRYPHWRRKDSPARQCKERAGWRCEQCDVANRTILHNALGEAYMCYLHAAHVHPLDPVQPEPISGQRLRCLCPSCHGAYDSSYRQRQEEVDHQIKMHDILIVRFITRRFLLVS